MSSCTKVLFVDSQSDLTSFIREFPVNNEQSWESKQVRTAFDAYKLLDNESFDVIVGELQLPDQDGADFINEVARKYPGTVRIILSSATDRETIMRTARNIHQFIAKPCEATTLGKVLSNSLSMRKLLSSEELHRRIAAVKTLPSPPEVYNNLVELLQSDNASMKQIADLISRDVGITAKLLQMVNSAFFGLSTHVESPRHAVTLLGLDTVQSLVLTAGVFEQFDVSGIGGISVESIHNRCVAVGSSARLIATAFGFNRRPTEEALMAGMLHDVGKLVMLSSFRDELQRSVELSNEERIPLWQAQKEIVGVSDAEIGAHLLSLWGLPDSILEAVALHYHPQGAPHPMLNVLTSVHIAYALNHDQTDDAKDLSLSALDMDYLSTLNLTDQLQSIKNLSMAATI